MGDGAPSAEIIQYMNKSGDRGRDLEFPITINSSLLVRRVQERPSPGSRGPSRGKQRRERNYQSFQMWLNRARDFLLFLPVLLAFSTSGHRQVEAMTVYTSGHVEALNGSDVRLKCTFKSSAPVRRSVLTISWTFKPLGPGIQESVFYYHEKPFLPKEGHFQNKVAFVGETSASDASILLRNVDFSYNGTFICQVRNPPDVHGNAGEVHLRVVTTAPFSEMVFLSVAIGGAVMLGLFALAVASSVRWCRKRGTKRRERLRQERKDLVVW